jgi:chromosome condensin MukBEF ATPase and DNA-binding subunit MukB
MSNDKTKRELAEVVEMHRAALEELAEAIEQRNEARRVAEHWKAQCQKGFNIAEIIQQRNMLAEALEKIVRRIEFYSATPDDQRPLIEQWEYTDGSSDMKIARKALAAVKGEQP